MKTPRSPFLFRHESSLSFLRFVISVFALVPLVVLPRGYALPTGAQVVAGQVNVAQSGAAMTLTQASKNAIVNWQSFNIGAGENVRLAQSGADAAMLARVTGNDPSKLLGSLKADGKLFLINPKGIVVGQGAVIDTAAFMASTLDVSDADFLRGTAMTFKGDSTAGIVNLGQITAHEGNVMLFAHTVNNTGTISAPKGTASLAAGSEVYLGPPDDSSVVIKCSLPSSFAKTGVENTGVIAAAQAELKAAGGSIYEVAINQSGVVRATGVENKNGRVLLTADGGTVGVSGSVTARNSDGSGGEILVGGDYRGGNKDVPNAARTVVTATAKLDASATTAEGKAGRAIVWADDATRFLGTIEAQGAGGGFAEVSGKHFLDFNPASTVNLGTNGTLLLDPDALIVSSSANSGTATSGTNPFTFSLNSEPATLNVTTLQNQLAASNVILDTSNSAGDITFNNAVTWATNNTLTAKAGGSININANLTGGATSTIELRPGKAAMPQLQGFNPINPKATLAAAATITTGTLTYGSNPNAAPANYTFTGFGTSAASFDGNLNVGTLQVDLTTGATGVSTSGSDNTIGAFRTLGTGDLNFARVVNHHGNLATKLTTSGSTANQILVTTPGTLTLESGSSVSFATPGTVVLASTAAGLNNQAGGSVFGANTNYLIYGVSTAATTKGGLTAGDVFSTTFDLNDPIGGFTGLDRFLYRAAGVSPVLTYTADSLSRSYGSANPAFTFSVTGIIGGITNDVTGTPSFSTTATQNSGVGGYAITIGQGSLLSTTSNYTFAFVPGTLTITAVPLTITANNKSRTSFGVNPTFDVSYSGFVLGQDSSVVSGLSVATTATGSSPVGNYPITPSGATAANYAITFVPGTLSITDTATLMITANNASRLYGAGNPTFTANYSGFIGADTSAIVSGVQFTSTASQTSGVGTYTITPFGATAPGYALSYQPGTLTIDRAPLLITPLNSTRLYGDANVLNVGYSGFVLGENSSVVSGLTFNTAGTPASSVGNYSFTASGASAANYAISYNSAAQLTINPAPLTVRFDDKSRVYGDADPAFTYSISGFKNGDNASIMNVSNISSGASLTSSAGSSFGISGTAFASTSNYVTNVVLGNLAINPRPLTITADNKTKVYGDANPALTATFSGLASFDTPASIAGFNLTTEATQTSGVSNFGIVFSLGHNPNYAITSKFGTLAITPASLSLLAPPDVNRVYGRADPTLPALNFGGLKNADTIAGLAASYVNVPAPTADAGNYTYGVAIKNPNYKLSGATTGLFRVDPAPLDVQIGGAGRTYGDANPTSYAVNAQGLAFGQTADQVLRVVNPADQTTGVGTYDLTAQLISKNYYFNSMTAGKLQINPRLLQFSIDNLAKYYAEPIPEFTYNFGAAGLAPADNITAIISGFKTATPVSTLTDVGLYRIDPIFKANPNYLVSWSPGYLAILPRPIEVAVRNAVTFGNDQIPDGFDATALGLDLITRFNEGGAGKGYSVVITGLPANTTVKDAFPGLLYTLSDTNTPSPIGTAVTDLSTVFPARAGFSAAAAPGTSLPPTLPPATVTLAPSRVNTPDIAPPLDAGSVKIGDKTYADSISYIVPKLGNGNYVITKITNGILTSKPDATVLQTLKEVQAFKDIVAAANQSFYWTGETDKTKTGAFGFTADMFPFLRDLLLQMLETGYDTELWAEVFD